MDQTIIAAMRVRLLERTRGEAALLEGTEQPDAERRAALVAWCHRLGGTAGTLGLVDLGAAALAMEDELRQVKLRFWPELRERLLAALRDG